VFILVAQQRNKLRRSCETNAAAGLHADFHKSDLVARNNHSATFIVSQS
jgi:hypothetical protein